MLVRMAATPSKNAPSKMIIAESFHLPHVPPLFFCRKGDSVMAVTIEPLLNSVRLRVTGDVETVLTVPYADDDRFVLGLSDGTLLLGTYDETLECSWEVAREGAGIVRFDGNRVVIEWCTEWVMASVYDPNVIEPRVPHTLPLFPDLDRWAA